VNAGHVPIGELLVQSGRLDKTQLERALELQRERGVRLGDAIVALGFLSQPVVLTEVARQRAVPYVELGTRNVPAQIVQLVPARFIRARRVFPFALGPHEHRGQLFVATTVPHYLGTLDEVAFMTGMAVKPVLVSDDDLDRAIERHLGRARPLGSSA
jgi:type IV pilus assembly protein PilB